MLGPTRAQRKRKETPERRGSLREVSKGFPEKRMLRDEEKFTR